jgi:hypothetical protein
MRMTVEEYKEKFPNRPEPIPAEYAGKWIAWNEARTQIVAHGDSLWSVREQALATGCRRPILHRIPRAPFIGRA